jgi:hypothetical protein
MMPTRKESDVAAATSLWSAPIGVGNETKSPSQWAAKLAPEGKVTQYKNAMLWLEGENFGSTDEFLAKVWIARPRRSKYRFNPPALPRRVRG